ncbi:MAG: hypothetical protein CMJ85_08745 [Planctomycetes bacterium]|jgi:ferrous iron transport protein A|nr:hypothetical protein [Planctomycetota bacterium]MDP6424937.1 FeoA family protein [Planctomycetota bacterium]
MYGKPKTLADLPELGFAIIRGSPGDAPLQARLRELGLCAGTDVEFERRAPLGDPMVVRFRGTRLCLRRAEAALIEVDPADEA